jgi:DNA polymerase (family 10)
MPVHNADIARVFDEIADLLEIQGENPFRIRAYRNAARTIGEFPRDLKSLIDSGAELPKLPGIGGDLDGKIHEICATGSCALIGELHKKLPAAIVALLALPGLGPKRVKILHDKLKVNTIADLEAAVKSGRVREIRGFGEKTEQHILQTLAARAAEARRFKLAVAMQYAMPLVAHLKRIHGVRDAVAAGSLRRMRETLGDVDLLVAAQTRSAAAVTAAFCTYDEVSEVRARGETRSTVVLKSGLQVDLRVVAPESYGAALHYFTGSKAHNIAVRRLGQERGLKINEYGVFRGSRRIAGETEESVFKSVGLPYIPPELREDRGEIDAARQKRLPHLVERRDLKGDLHAHTTETDGRSTLHEMAAAARDARLSYLAITDHSRHLTVARGMDARRVLKQIDEIDRLNAKLEGIALLKGVEVDILEDGSLDLPDSVLSRLDLVVAAIHTAFALPREKQMKRLLRAMNSRYFTILAHPATRLIGEREGCDLDMAMLVREAKMRGCFLELDSQPDRLDLEDIYCQMARDEGVLISIDSDAHSKYDFSYLDYGIGQARRGWLEARDVLNTRELSELRLLLRRTMCSSRAAA